MGIGKHERPNKGDTDTWLTPINIVNQLGEFDLDPCAHTDMPYSLAKKSFTILDDGLKQPWFGRVWMNPPYSKNLDFADKFAKHRNGIALVFARTETKWFSKFYDADAFLFLYGRITFNKADGLKGEVNAGAPSVLVAYGPTNVDALQCYQTLNGGLLLEKRENKHNFLQ